ncbi:thioredoxin domain-containing protein PLP3A-like [Phalaenopsis equestris]|uniref:thioredoxin domain-containing protein PLP3A-like n=1 Tax=Phalaenopsis equestris TaxID=78828 RepID=UPI0009E29B73|nr:thioredoxin domain-containing protein PLP3A-like [Phalaenopsis equestris]
MAGGGVAGKVEFEGTKRLEEIAVSKLFDFILHDIEAVGCSLQCVAIWRCRRPYELVANEKAQTSSHAATDEVDLDELLDDPELEKLHAERIAALKKEAEKREVLKRQGHGEYREITEADFLGEVTGSQKVICHFYHREFYRCKIMDKHLKALAPIHFDTKFIKLDAENAPFFVKKLAIKTLPCVVLFRNGIGFDRLVGFQDLGSKDDFTSGALEHLFKRKGIIDERKGDNDEDAEEETGNSRSIRASTNAGSDSD